MPGRARCSATRPRARGQPGRHLQHAIVLLLVAQLPPGRVVQVLAAPRVVRADRLDVPVGPAADPHVVPGGRDHQVADAAEHLGIGDAVLTVEIAEPTALPPTGQPVLRRRDGPQAHLRIVRAARELGNSAVGRRADRCLDVRPGRSGPNERQAKGRPHLEQAATMSHEHRRPGVPDHDAGAGWRCPGGGAARAGRGRRPRRPAAARRGRPVVRHRRGPAQPRTHPRPGGGRRPVPGSRPAARLAGVGVERPVDAGDGAGTAGCGRAGAHRPGGVRGGADGLRRPRPAVLGAHRPRVLLRPDAAVRAGAAPLRGGAGTGDGVPDALAGGAGHRPVEPRGDAPALGGRARAGAPDPRQPGRRPAPGPAGPSVVAGRGRAGRGARRPRVPAGESSPRPLPARGGGAARGRAGPAGRVGRPRDGGHGRTSRGPRPGGDRARPGPSPVGRPRGSRGRRAYRRRGSRGPGRLAGPGRRSRTCSSRCRRNRACPVR